jgi:integrase/recombinase XerD
MNPKDVAFLKYKNIDGEYFTFERAKTERSTRTDPKPITVFITEEMQNIIASWGNKDRKPNNYIFPILTPDMNPLDQHFAVKAFVKFINHWMAKIKSALGIEMKVRSLEARHTFSTQLKRAGASTEYIQEALGHMDKKTTENYLNSFKKEVKKEYAAKLTPFKSESNSETKLYVIKQ